jgi:hypothetical protein
MTVTKRVFNPLERIEFGFVFLPEDYVIKQIKNISETVNFLLEKLPLRQDIPKYWGDYKNKIAVLPHLTIGQYGLLGCDLDILKNIVKNVSKKTSIINQKMEKKLSVLDDYIFFDSAELYENVHTAIKNTYLELRQLYLSEIHTKYPISQVLFAKKQFFDNDQELNLIANNFQNWGTPENDRMRPHFTVLYHPPYEIEKMIDILNANKDLGDQIKNLSNVKLTRLAALQIDAFGNPIEDKLLCDYPLVER